VYLPLPVIIEVWLAMKLSVVSPVYMGEEVLVALVERLIFALSKADYGFEIVLVDDGSPDRSWEVISSLSRQFHQIRAIRLSRNFGQHVAITAGLDVAEGDVIVVMDCDLQDQPEEVPALVDELNNSECVDCVIALRKIRRDGFSKRLGSRVFYWLLNLLTGMELDSRAANFGAYSRQMIDQILKMREPDRSFPFCVHWVGFKRKYLEVAHAPRHAGVTSYTFYKLLKLAVAIGMGVSDRPMRIVMGVGAGLSVSSFLLGLLVLFRYFLGYIAEPGYASLVLSIWFFSGVIILFIGFVGLYVGRIFLASKSRPLYVTYKPEHKNP